jgi:mannitol-1-phosphate/altronate dehydrogenase
MEEIRKVLEEIRELLKYQQQLLESIVENSERGGVKSSEDVLQNISKIVLSGIGSKVDFPKSVVDEIIKKANSLNKEGTG